MPDFYPPITPYNSFFLEAGDGHRLYVEECGNPGGLPVVFLHGGPGSGCEPWHRQFFDPAGYRIILFDQRGSGRSTPHASLEANTTPHLIADMEALRERLGLERWVVFGGSWGSTLGLAYAEAHPARVAGLILRGIFLCTPEEIAWFYQRGANLIFPDYWEDYLAPIPPAERDDLLHAYHQRLISDDAAEQLAAARAWSVWEGRCATLLPNTGTVESFADPHRALSLARIECHYFVNNIFLRPNQLLDEAHKLRGIPGDIIHGRYDVICPLDNAWQLAKQWPDAALRIIPDAGHAAGEAGIRAALVDAADAMLARLT